jgi:hypothetical protein
MTEPRDEETRRRQLGVDPATQRYRPLEEGAALRLEHRVGPLRRDPTGTCDWIDGQGRTYDAVGPVPAGRLNMGVIPDSRSTCDKIGESELKAKQS